ncbi:MAG: aminoacetone oxidase family FAD-binding enzyme [Vicinamibacterales bacterium]
MPRVVVIGAGAAGTMAAIFAATEGVETVLLERTKDGGRKILISGGGRCNVLPARLDESRFVTDSSPHLLRRIVRSWPLHEQIAFFERELGLPLVEETASGKLFPKSQSARDVRDTLLTHARRKGVTIVTDTFVTGIRPSVERWIIERQDGEPLDADAVVLATGGLSVPNTGSDGRGLEIADALGHALNPTYAALTPLTARPKQETASPPPFAHLSGVSLPITITARSGAREAHATGGFLFTHQGYSGPSVLDVSHVAVRSLAGEGTPAKITVQWTPLRDSGWEDVLRPRATRTVLAAISDELPLRLADALVAAARVEPTRALAQLGRAERLRLIEVLVRGELPWTGDEGYKKAEVTGGGVNLAEIDARTMESRKHEGLFMCGEMLDAFGPIGGYNFLWAWATGRAAGLGAANRLR